MKRDLRALIKADAGIVALAPGGIDWGARAQGSAGPAVVLHQISGAGGHVQSGPDCVFQGRVQIDCYAERYDAVDAMAQALIGLLDGYRADAFLGIFHDATREGRETDAEREFRISLDFMVHHRSE